MHLFELQAAMMKSLMDATTSMMAAATGFWTQALPGPRSPLSTASPWWIPPQTPATLPFGSHFLPPAFGASPFDPRSWMPMPQVQPTSMFGTSPLALMPWAAFTAPFMALPGVQSPWSPNPFALMAQFAPWSGAAQAPPLSKPWDDMFAAYRSASGHATAVIIKAMSPPQPEPQRLLPLWPFLAPYGSNRLH